LLNKFFAFLCLMGASHAHPHVTINYKAAVVITDGKVTGVKHHWQFDELFSSAMTQGLGEKKDGKPTQNDLAVMARENLSNLGELNYYTSASLNKIKLAFDKPIDGKMDFEKDKLTLSFTLPLRSPIAIEKHDFLLDIYDISFFVNFQPADGEFIKAEGAGCKADYRPPVKTTSSLSKLGESFFDTLSNSFAKDFTSSMVISCR
jgi:ABC-type uncharacterized transport system substrate-binding protein